MEKMKEYFLKEFDEPLSQAAYTLTSKIPLWLFLLKILHLGTNVWENFIISFANDRRFGTRVFAL